MEVTEKFEQLTKSESLVFPSLVEIMYHSKKEKGRKFLCTMNNIIDCALNQPLSESNSINYQVIHIPFCPDWARELLVRFTIHKSALSLNRIMLDKFINSIQKEIISSACFTNKETNKETSRKRVENNYFKKVRKEFKELINSIPNNCIKSFILVKKEEIDVENKDRKRMFTDNITSIDYNVFLSNDKSAFDLEKEIKLLDRKSMEIPIIENVFIFHSTNKARLTNSFNNDQLQRLNRYGLGIKNCFVFSFSDQPFKLYYTIENVKYRLTSGLSNKEVKKYNDFNGFITFTQEESEYLFNQVNTQHTVVVDTPEREYFTLDIDSIFEQMPHNYRYKNALSLAFSDDLQQKFIEDVSTEIGNINPSVFADFFNYYKHFWNENIKVQINTFLNDNKSIALIISKETPKYVKDSLKNLFSIEHRQIAFHSIEDLKNGISANKIVVLQYRYTDKRYKSFPNSFDPLPLKDGQEVLVIINRLTHNNYYEWNKHHYDKDFNGLLYSTFRKDKLGWSIRNYQRPLLSDIRDYIDEAEVDNREYQAEKCIVFYTDGNRREYLACERALYLYRNKYYIAQLKDLATFEDMEIQILDEIVEQIRMSLIKKTADNSKAEEYIRQDKRYNLTEIEIISSIELWKFLLKRKVDELGIENVYNEIFSSTQEISLNGFKRWSDLDNPMIFPRSRRSQNALLKYLGFELGSPYHRIILAKKLININNSRELNRQIESLLQTILTQPIVTEKDFEVIMDSNSDILTLLDIRNANDANALVDLIDISLKKVIRIEYDQE